MALTFFGDGNGGRESRSKTRRRDLTSLRVSHSLLHLYLTAYLRKIREFHREKLSLSNVGRLDNLIMCLYSHCCRFNHSHDAGRHFFCVELSWTKVLCIGSPTCRNYRDWHFGHIIFCTGNFLIPPRTGLSWLIGSSLHDIITSIAIFLSGTLLVSAIG